MRRDDADSAMGVRLAGAANGADACFFSGKRVSTGLKIDQCFVTDTVGHPQRSVVLESRVDMAHKLGLKVVAEGVETRADWNRLKRIGCSLAQG
jgi:predicted signal transduction protein with EAL and GGDEF domain